MFPYSQKSAIFSTFYCVEYMGGHRIICKFNDEAVFTMSTRGRFKLVHNGFEYFQGRVTKDVTYWRCKDRIHNRCKGKAITQNVGSKEVVKSYGIHNHGPLKRPHQNQ